MPIEYIPIMRAYYEKSGWGEYPIAFPKGDPWSILAKPLADSCVSMVCSAGLSRRDQPLFDPEGADDLSIREIAVDTPRSDLVINYNYFDHRDADEDINCIFPVDRLRELEEQGLIGRLAPIAYGIGVGRWKQPSTPDLLQQEVAADLASRCRDQGADAVLLIPT